MLLTRCPSCDTAFRITAELLKQASGQVRCGRCNHVFPAFAHLEEAQATPDAHGIGSYSPPADDPSMPASGGADELAETNEYQALLAAETDHELDTADGETPIGVEGVTADELMEIFDGDPARADRAAGGETLATENKALLATIDPDEPLDLELPQDGSQASDEQPPSPDVFDGQTHGEEIILETPTEDLIPAATEADQDPAELPAAEAGQDAPEVPADEEGANTRLEENSPAADEAVEQDAAQETAAPGDHVIDFEQARADARPPELDPEEPWALATGVTARAPSGRSTVWWGVGAGSLVLVLLLQLGHHFRNELAAGAQLGPLVRSVYAALGVDLAPDWDVAQYEIDDWVATAGPDEAGQESLTITATLLNRGPRDQPHPYVRLELKDRWDEPVGSRVFKPDEYLAQPPDPDELMASGARVPALLAVVDPGNDAYGFELDVCVPSGADQLRCANQNVF